jgi:hypothetical protein
MAITAQRARELLLKFLDVSEVPHLTPVAFRTPRRIFATLALDGGGVNFMLDPVEQDAFCEMAPHALMPVPGGWDRMGATRCDIEKVDQATFAAASEAAYPRESAPRNKGRGRC